MRPGFSLVLLHATFVSLSIVASADSIPSVKPIPGCTQRHLRSSNTNADANADEEERVLGFSGLKKLKNLIRGNTKSVVTLQKSTAVMKEVEGLKNSPVLAKGFKRVSENRVMMKRINSLEKMDPNAVETLRKAPVEKSVKRVNSYLTRGQSFHISEETQWVIFFISFFFIMGGIIGLIALVEKLAGPNIS